jgi:glycosyltransferase involved in cell wall biosynthesis
MHILAIGDGPLEDVGGLSRYLGGLAGAMVARGNRVVPVVAPSSGSLLTRALRVTRAVHRHVRHRAIDVIDVHFALYAWLPLRLRSVRSVPLVVHFQGPWADEAALAGASRPKRVVQRAIERSVYHRAQSIVVLSEAFRDLIIERYRVDPARVVVIPPGIDLDRFAPGARWCSQRPQVLV